jgi:hypothetical protein
LKATGGKFLVQYLDYGNSEIIEKSSLRELPPKFSIQQLPPQATESRLAFIDLPLHDEEHGPAVFNELCQLVGNKKLLGYVAEKRNGISHVVLFENKSIGGSGRIVSVNEKLVRSGLALVSPNHAKRFEREQLGSSISSVQNTEISRIISAQEVTKSARVMDN